MSSESMSTGQAWLRRMTVRQCVPHEVDPKLANAAVERSTGFNMWASLLEVRFLTERFIRANWNVDELWANKSVTYAAPYAYYAARGSAGVSAHRPWVYL